MRSDVFLFPKTYRQAVFAAQSVRDLDRAAQTGGARRVVARISRAVDSDADRCHLGGLELVSEDVECRDARVELGQCVFVLLPRRGRSEKRVDILVKGLVPLAFECGQQLVAVNPGAV